MQRAVESSRADCSVGRSRIFATRADQLQILEMNTMRLEGSASLEE